MPVSVVYVPPVGWREVCIHLSPYLPPYLPIHLSTYIGGDYNVRIVEKNPREAVGGKDE